MGRRYSFELFYPAEQIEAGLRALDEHLPTIRRKRTGQPVKGSARSGPIDLSALSPDSPLFQSVSLLFPSDEVVRRYRTDWEDDQVEWDDEGNEYLPVGVINLTIRRGEKYALFTYAACTSGMSDVFEQSRGVWKQFDKILRASGGLVALFRGAIPREPARYPVLPDGDLSDELNYFNYVLEERDVYWHIDVDRFVVAVLRATGKGA